MVKDASPESIVQFDALLFKPPADVKAEVMREQPEWANAGEDFVAQMATRGTRTTG